MSILAARTKDLDFWKMLSSVLPERKRRTGAAAPVPVYLNVYDLTPLNGYAYWFGLGVYHSGVQVHGVEYAFGAHEHSGTGVFQVEPRRCPGFTFRKSILIGRTDMDSEQVRNFMEQNICRKYAGNTYNLITRNCNHFCNDVCINLTGKAIPRWVNRLARLGLFCNCVLPAAVNETVRIRQVRVEGNEVRLGERGMKRPPSTTTTLSTTLCPWSAQLPVQHQPLSSSLTPPLSSTSSKQNSEKEDCCLPSTSPSITCLAPALPLSKSTSST